MKNNAKLKNCKKISAPIKGLLSVVDGGNALTAKDMTVWWADPMWSERLRYVAKILGKPSKEVFFVDAGGTQSEQELFEKLDEGTRWMPARAGDHLGTSWALGAYKGVTVVVLRDGDSQIIWA